MILLFPITLFGLLFLIVAALVFYMLVIVFYILVLAVAMYLSMLAKAPIATILLTVIVGAWVYFHPPSLHTHNEQKAIAALQAAGYGPAVKDVHAIYPVGIDVTLNWTPDYPVQYTVDLSPADQQYLTNLCARFTAALHDDSIHLKDGLKNWYWWCESSTSSTESSTRFGMN